MSPQQFVTNNNDKVIGSGQCGDLVDLVLVDIYGNHTEYATAYDYWVNGIPGFSVVSGSPQDGDIGCYKPHSGFPDGHITMHYQGEEFEQNADPDGSPAHLYPRATTYLLGYLREDSMDIFNAGDRYNLLEKTVGKQYADQAAANNYFGNQLDGKTSYKDAVEVIIYSTQYQQWITDTQPINKTTVEAYIQANLS